MSQADGINPRAGGQGQVLDRALDIVESVKRTVPGTARHGRLITAAVELIERHPDCPNAIVAMELVRSTERGES